MEHSLSIAHPPTHPPTGFRSRRRSVADEAFGITANELVAIVRRMVRRAAGGVTHDLEDAVQETLCRLLTVDRYRFDSTRSLQGFIALRARWTLMDGRRRQTGQGRTDARHLAGLEVASASVEDNAIDAEDAAVARDRARAVSEAMAGLEPEARSLLQAHDVDGVSLRALASQQGVNVSTLSRRRTVALRQLASGVASVACGPSASIAR